MAPQHAKEELRLPHSCPRKGGVLTAARGNMVSSLVPRGGDVMASLLECDDLTAGRRDVMLTAFRRRSYDGLTVCRGGGVIDSPLPEEMVLCTHGC